MYVTMFCTHAPVLVLPSSIVDVGSEEAGPGMEHSSLGSPVHILSRQRRQALLKARKTEDGRTSHVFLLTSVPFDKHVNS